MTSSPSAPLADALRPFVDRGLLAGAIIAAADRERVLALETVGWADLAARSPMREDALFWIASMTKPMTATALMMLVDEGKVALDDPVADYLPDFGSLLVQAAPDEAPRPPARPVRVRDLLSHTSGLPFAAPEEERYKDALSPEEGARAYARLRLQSDPGTRYCYSNAGINTAARVLEVAGGESYEAFLSRRLLEPLGMWDTVFRPAGERLARLAKAYREGKGEGEDTARSGLEETCIDQLRYPLDDPSRGAMAGGGLFSTVADVLRFGRMILRGGELDGRRYLSPEALGAMTSRQTGSLPENYGLGWGVYPGGFGHSGACRTDMWINTQLGIVRIFLVQQCGPWAGGKEGEKIFPAYVQATEALASAGSGAASAAS